METKTNDSNLYGEKPQDEAVLTQNPVGQIEEDESLEDFEARFCKALVEPFFENKTEEAFPEKEEYVEVFFDEYTEDLGFRSPESLITAYRSMIKADQNGESMDYQKLSPEELSVFRKAAVKFYSYLSEYSLYELYANDQEGEVSPEKADFALSVAPTEAQFLSLHPDGHIIVNTLSSYRQNFYAPDLEHFLAASQLLGVCAVR